MKNLGPTLLLLAAFATSAWLRAAEPKEPAPKDFAIKGELEEGKRIYATYCKKCHGEKGNGQGLMAKDLDPKPADFTNADKMSEVSDWELFVGVRDGGPPVGKSDKMTPNKDVLSEQEMHDVIVYVKTFWEKSE